jgi:hypothetical protein
LALSFAAVGIMVVIVIVVVVFPVDPGIIGAAAPLVFKSPGCTQDISRVTHFFVKKS